MTEESARADRFTTAITNQCATETEGKMKIDREEIILLVEDMSIGFAQAMTSFVAIICPAIPKDKQEEAARAIFEFAKKSVELSLSVEHDFFQEEREHLVDDLTELRNSGGVQ